MTTSSDGTFAFADVPAGIYTVVAKKDGYRGRAAYKILEIDDRFRFLVAGARVVDLGCAPGGWCQVAVPRVNALGEKSGKARGTILGVDLQEVEPIAGTELMHLDFLDDGADDAVKARLGGQADVVMSDMAASASGHRQTDHAEAHETVLRAQERAGVLHDRRADEACRGAGPDQAKRAIEVIARCLPICQAAILGVDQFGIEHVEGDEMEVGVEFGLAGEVAENVGDAVVGVADREAPGRFQAGAERRIVEARLAAEQPEL